jgi:hypothetical protein
MSDPLADLPADGRADPLTTAIDKMEAALVEWSHGVQSGRSHFGSEGCLKFWYDSAIGQFCLEGEDMKTTKRDRLLSTILWWAEPRKKPERAPDHKALSERCISAEDRVAALEKKCRDLLADADASQHWQTRALKAEAALAKARDDNERLTTEIEDLKLANAYENATQ